MTTTVSKTSPNNTAILTLLAAAAAVLVAGAAFQVHAQLGLTDRTAYLILAGIGFVMCSFSPLGQGRIHGWANPRHIAGYLLGAIALLLSLAVLLNWPLPSGLSHGQAIYLLAGVMALKVIVGALYPRVRS